MGIAARCHHTQLGTNLMIPKDSDAVLQFCTILMLSKIYCHCGVCIRSHFRMDEVRASAEI